MSFFTKSNLRGPSRDCCKVSRSSREQKRCPMRQNSPTASKEILEKTSRRIFQDWFKVSLKTMCLVLPPGVRELSVANCKGNEGFLKAKGTEMGTGYISPGNLLYSQLPPRPVPHSASTADCYISVQKEPRTSKGSQRQTCSGQTPSVLS